MMKKTLFRQSLFTLIIALLMFTLFGFGMTYIASNYDQGWISQVFEGIQLTSVVNQWIAMAVLFVMGFVALFPFAKKIGMTQVFLLSYLVGLLGFCLISVLLLVLHIYYAFWSALAAYGVIVAAIYYFALKKDSKALRTTADSRIKLIFWVVGFLALGFLLARVPIMNLSFDSIQYRILGKCYAVEHHFASYFYYEMAGRAFIPALLSSISVFFNFEYAYAIQNMFLVNSILLFGYLLYKQTRTYGANKKSAKIMAGLGTAILGTSFFVLFLGITLVPNSFTGFCFLFMMVYAYQYINKKQSIDLGLMLFFMLAFSFTRVEAPLVAAFVMAYLAHKEMDAKSILLVIGSLLGFLLLWYISFMLHVGADYEGRFLTFGKSMINIALLVMVAGYTVIKNRFLNKHNDKLFVLFVCAVIVFTISASLLDIDKFLVNVRVTYLNMFAEGLWTTAWFAVGIFGLIAMAITKKDNHVLEGIIPIYLFLIIAIFAFRGDNLHINWSDSGNRLLMHIYPLAVFAVADNVISYFAKTKDAIKR